MYIYVCVYIYVYICVCVYIYVYVCVCIYVCAYIYKHIYSEILYIYIHILRSVRNSHCGSVVMNPTSIHEDAGSIPGPNQWVDDLVLL